MMVDKRKTINHEDISRTFGLNSAFYFESIKFLTKESLTKKNQFELTFKKWKSVFINIYGEDIDVEFFLKHCYYALVLKNIINITLHERTENKIIVSSYEANFYELEYFSWTNLNGKLKNKIKEFLKSSVFEHQDLFQKLYQQVFLVLTRHKLGEYYTSPLLVSSMVDDFYVFGTKILDPSCGSGSFLIDIIASILHSKKSLETKSKAISNVFGFDVNLLATLTAKSNILLLILDVFKLEDNNFPDLNIFLLDPLFPDEYDNDNKINLKNLRSSFDLVIGNPPWLTYKDLIHKKYQTKVRDLADFLGIKPSSQYITHIEMAAVFFYAIPYYFLKKKGRIFFVITKSILNGDHCNKFRAFTFFSDLEIWDFPRNYFFNVDHVCLKARYLGPNNKIPTTEKYPIYTKLLNDKMTLQEEVHYDSLKIEESGVKLILPAEQVAFLSNLKDSTYKKKFFQGATIVPRTLVFFTLDKKSNNKLIISSDEDVISRAKKKWEYRFENKTIDENFRYKTFLNLDLIPFFIKNFRDVFLPVNDDLQFDVPFLKRYTNSRTFYEEINAFYKKNKKITSTIDTLFDNLNYWNKLSKQINNKQYIVVYNASGSNLKSAVIHNEENRIIIGSENYYYSTDIEPESFYLSAILNSPILSKYIKLIKSSRHIHKRPFSFPIPIYDDENEIHRTLAKKGKKYHTVVQDLALNNPKITAEKTRIFIYRKLEKLDQLTKQTVFE